MSMTEKKTRLLCEDDVIKAVDKHTKEGGAFDDISCILEEVDDALLSMKPTEMKIMSDVEYTITVPRVFIFNSNLSPEQSEMAQEFLKKQIKQGCLVIPEDIEFIGIEEPLVVLP